MSLLEVSISTWNRFWSKDSKPRTEDWLSHSFQESLKRPNTREYSLQETLGWTHYCKFSEKSMITLSRCRTSSIMLKTWWKSTLFSRVWMFKISMRSNLTVFFKIWKTLATFVIQQFERSLITFIKRTRWWCPLSQLLHQTNPSKTKQWEFHLLSTQWE